MENSNSTLQKALFTHILEMSQMHCMHNANISLSEHAQETEFLGF